MSAVERYRKLERWRDEERREERKETMLRIKREGPREERRRCLFIWHFQILLLPVTTV